MNDFKKCNEKKLPENENFYIPLRISILAIKIMAYYKTANRRQATNH